MSTKAPSSGGGGATHAAVVMTSVGGPLELQQVPTHKPTEAEVRVRVEWTASTPLDLHQADGGLLVKHPQIQGDGIAGTVVEVGPDVRDLRVGDKVFGFGWRSNKEKAFQEFATLPENLLGKLPKGFTLQEAVTLPNNFVTVFHAITTDMCLPLPWPISSDHVPAEADAPILIWGGASSCGQYALQVLHRYGYRNLLATASPQHHSSLRGIGASRVFDYRDASVVDAIRDHLDGGSPSYIFDCVASRCGSVLPIARLATAGAKVAVLLPVIVRDAAPGGPPPVYELDVREAAQAADQPFADGVDARGVRTHFYLQNELFATRLQPEIMPAALAEGWVRPNKQRIVKGASMLERAQAALDLLRARAPSGERLVWRVADD